MRQPHPSTRWLRITSLVLLVALAALAVLLVTQPGRAFAKRLFLFFQGKEETSFVVPTGQDFSPPATLTPSPTLVAPLPSVEEFLPEPIPPNRMPLVVVEETRPLDSPCSTPALENEYDCQIRAVEEQAGFDVKEFLYDPQGTRFSRAIFDPDTNQVTLEFIVRTGGGYLYLRQGVDEFLQRDEAWGTLPSFAVDQGTVNGNYAEIATGTYMVSPGDTVAAWKPGGQLSLVWREGNRWYVLEKFGDPAPIEWLTRDEMIGLAESLIAERPLDAVPPLDPDYLERVEDAERLAGFDVSEPTSLPEGYEFKYALLRDSTVVLVYGPKNAANPSDKMIIITGLLEDAHIGPCLNCPDVENVQIGAWQGWYWRDIIKGVPNDEGQQLLVPFWKQDVQIWHLTWNTDRMSFSLSFASYDFAPEVSKEVLIAIAEGMQ